MRNNLKVIIMQGQSCLGKSTLCRKLSGIISDCTYLCVDKYKEKNWDMNYIYNRYARVYYNQIIDIYKPNNPANKKEKNQQLQEIISKKEYKEELKKLEKNVTDKKMKIAIKYFFLKGKTMIKLFVFLNNVRKG